MLLKFIGALVVCIVLAFGVVYVLKWASRKSPKRRRRD
jgi:hypothetical protein